MNDNKNQSKMPDIDINRWVQLGQMTAGIAHELNIPVTGLVSFSQVCQKGVETNDLEKVRRGLSQMQVSISYINDLVQRLLGFSRGNPKHIITPFHIQEVVDTVVLLAGPQLARKQISITQSVSADCQTISGNPIELAQVLINLIMNAFHAISHDHGQIDITATQQDATLQILVSDNGPGIPPEIIQSIFELAFSTKSEPGHLGFGLAITRDIINQLRGTISVESTVGEGTTFTIQIPTTKSKRKDK